MNSQEDKQKTTKTQGHRSRKKREETLFDRYFKKYGVWLATGLVAVVGLIVFKDFLTLQKLYYFNDIGSDTVNEFLAWTMNKDFYGVGAFDLRNWSFYSAMGMPQGISEYSLPSIARVVSEISSLFTGFFEDGYLYKVAYNQYLAWITCSLLGFFYFRLLKLNLYTSIIGAILISFCGYNIVGSSWHAPIFAVSKVLFVLVSFELLFSRKVWFLFPIAIYSLTLPELYFTVEFLAVYFLFRFFSKEGWKPRKFAFLSLQLMLLGVVAILFKAPNFVKDVTRIVDSPRASGSGALINQLKDLPIFGFEAPIHYTTLIMRTFANDLLGNGSGYQGWYNYFEAPNFYCGLITLLLLPLVFPFLKTRQKVFYGLFIGFWVLICIFPFFRYVFYKFAGNYYRKALSVFIPISMLLMAMQALHLIVTRKKLNYWVLGINFVSLLALLFYPYSSTEGIIRTDLQYTAAVFLVLYAVAIPFLTFKRWQFIAQVSLILLVCIEVAYLNSKTLQERDSVSKAKFYNKNAKGYNDHTIDAVNYLRSIDSKDFYRVTKDYFSGSAIHAGLNDAEAQGFYGTSSYRSFNSRYYLNFLHGVGIVKNKNDVNNRWAEGLVSRPLLLSLASTKYALSKNNQQKYTSLGYEPLQKFGNVTVLKNPFFMPFGIGYDKYVVYDDFVKLTNLKKDKVLMKAVVLTKSQAQKYTDLEPLDLATIDDKNYRFENLSLEVEQLKSSSWKITEVEKDESKIKGETNFSRPKMMMFSTPYYNGWSAYINGKEVDVEVVNVGLLGVMVPEGTQSLVLDFSLPFSFQGTILFFISFIVFLLFIWWFYRHKTSPQNQWRFLGSLLLLPLLLLIQFPVWELVFVALIFAIWKFFFDGKKSLAA